MQTRKMISLESMWKDLGRSPRSLFGIVAAVGCVGWAVAVWTLDARPARVREAEPARERDVRFGEFETLRDDYAWGLLEIIKSAEESPEEKQNRLEQYQRLNARVAQRRDALRVALAEDYPSKTVGGQRSLPVPPDSELAQIEGRLAAAQRHFREAEDATTRQRMLEQYLAENKADIDRRDELLLGLRSVRLVAARAAGTLEPRPWPEAVLGTAEEAELLDLRKRFGEDLLAAIDPDDKEMHPAERQARIEKVINQGGGVPDRLAQLQQEVGLQHAERLSRTAEPNPDKEEQR